MLIRDSVEQIIFFVLKKEKIRSGPCDGPLSIAPAALQQREARSPHARESLENEGERKRIQQQRQKRAPGDSEETASSDDRDSDFSLSGRYRSPSGNALPLGAGLSCRFSCLFQVWDHQRCTRVHQDQASY